MSTGTILLVVLIVILIAVFPRWSHSSNWGYAPSGTVALITAFVVLLVMAGRL